MTTGRCREFLGTPLATSSTKILLLGGGELGKEVVLEAHKLGVEAVVVDRYDNAPAMHVAHRKYVLNMLEGRAVREVVRRERPDAIIPEVEAIDTAALKDLESEGYVVIPNAEAVRICMNRVELREFLAKVLGLPTTRYSIADCGDELVRVCDRVGYPCIVKPEMSSSGHGHVVIREPLRDVDYGEVYRLAVSGSRGLSRRVVVEEFVKLVSEYTVLVYRSLQLGGGVVTRALEPIEHWRYGKFHYIESWQPSVGPEEVLSRCRDYAVRVAEALGGLGVYGVELFLTDDGRVLVSEVAPRPHDTGFVTLVTQDLSEFAIHLRASLGLPVPKVNLVSAGASYAIYSEEEGVWGPRFYGVCYVLSVDGVDVRIFGKPSTYRGRRMAVVLARGATAEEARAKLREVISLLKVTGG